MAKREPLPSRAEQEAFIRLVADEPYLPLSQLKPASLARAYGYARGVVQRGEYFNYKRATGHPKGQQVELRPPIEHHDYQTEKMLALSPQRYKRYSTPMLEDWYIGDREECDYTPALVDVLRLLEHPENRQAEFLVLAFVGYVEYADGHQEPDATSNATDRQSLLAAIKRVKNLYELYNLLNPDTKLDGSPPPLKVICQISLRPAIERGGLAKKVALAPPKPETVVKPLSKAKRKALQKGLKRGKKL